MTYDLFVSGRRVRQLVERNFEIIGLRNQLIHAYDNMDWELIWQITSSLCQCCEPKLINF